MFFICGNCLWWVSSTLPNQPQLASFRPLDTVLLPALRLWFHLFTELSQPNPHSSLPSLISRTNQYIGSPLEPFEHGACATLCIFRMFRSPIRNFFTICYTQAATRTFIFESICSWKALADKPPCCAHKSTPLLWNTNSTPASQTSFSVSRTASKRIEGPSLQCHPHWYESLSKLENFAIPARRQKYATCSNYSIVLHRRNYHRCDTT